MKFLKISPSPPGSTILRGGFKVCVSSCWGWGGSMIFNTLLNHQELRVLKILDPPHPQHEDSQTRAETSLLVTPCCWFSMGWGEPIIPGFCEKGTKSCIIRFAIPHPMENQQQGVSARGQIFKKSCLDFYGRFCDSPGRKALREVPYHGEKCISVP